MLYYCSGLFVLRSLFVQVHSVVGISFGNHTEDCISTGLINLDCSGVTTENSAICAFLLIKYDDSVVSVTLSVIFLSIIVDIEWKINKLAVSLNFCRGVTHPLFSIPKGDQ